MRTSTKQPSGRVFDYKDFVAGNVDAAVAAANDWVKTQPLRRVVSVETVSHDTIRVWYVEPGTDPRAAST